MHRVCAKKRMESLNAHTSGGVSAKKSETFRRLVRSKQQMVGSRMTKSLLLVNGPERACTLHTLRLSMKCLGTLSAMGRLGLLLYVQRSEMHPSC